jgi:hypothetical protein
VNGVTFSGVAILKWGSAAAAGSGTVYDVLRGTLDELPAGSGPSEVCLRSRFTGTTTTDVEIPVFDPGFWYLIRARNNCGVGIYGRHSDGTVISSGTCPDL